MPKDQPGPERKDDRQIISGILHVLTSGSRWRDCPVAYGPRTTVYARFNRRSRRGFWKSTLAALAKAEWSGDAAALDSSSNRLKDLRRIATRYDKLARNYASALALAAVIAFRC